MAGQDGPEFIAGDVVELVIDTGVECDTDDAAGEGCRLVRVK